MNGRMLFSMAIGAGKPGPNGTQWQEIVSVGQRFSPFLERDPKPIIVTGEMVDDFVRNFSVDLPIDVEHARWEGSKDPEAVMARGWIRALKREGDRLFGAIQWVGKGVQWIKDGGFKRLSIELAKTQSTTSAAANGWSLRGASLTNHPLWGVPDLAMSVRSYQRYGAEAGRGESSQRDQYPSVHDPTEIADTEDSMSDYKALAKRLGIREDQVDAHVDTLATRATEADTSSAEVVKLTARIGELEDAAKSDAQKAEDAAIVLALEKGAIRNDGDEEADARFIFSERGPEAFERMVMSRAAVKTDSKLAGRKDTSKVETDDGDDDLDRGSAGQKLHELTRAHMVEKGEASYASAFAVVRANPDHKSIVDAYEEV